MTIAFLGHGNISNTKALSDKIRETIIANIKECDSVNFYCGGYGDFDNISALVCNQIKKEIPAKVFFITPYITENQQKKTKLLLESAIYDYVLYPPIEKTPLKFAIVKRNEWIIKEADLIICFVSRKYGGAYTALKYALRKGKRIINLAEQTQ